MQEYTILDHLPLGIDRYTAFRHRPKGILRRACVIDIPSIKYISGRSMRSIRFIVVIGTYIRTVCNIGCGPDLALVLIQLSNFISVTIYVDSIHEVDRVNITSIEALNISGVAVIPYCILLLIVGIICPGWIRSTTF